MGRSAGGDGIYQVAPRMADRFAAAAMSAGHPNDSSPLGLRNTAFTIHMGENDSLYNRNDMAVKWGNDLRKLNEEDEKVVENSKESSSEEEDDNDEPFGDFFE